MRAVEMKLAVGARGYRVSTHGLQVRAKIDVLNVGIIRQPLVCAANSRDTTGCAGQLRSETLVIGGARLQMQHAGHDLQTVLDPVVDFFEQNLMTVQCGLEMALVSVPLDGHPKDVCRTL